MFNMDRKAFGKKTLNTQRARADRFIVPRLSLPEYRRRVSWGNHCKEQPVGEIWYTKYLKQKKYMRYLDGAFSLEPLTIQEQKDSREPHKNLEQTWPCVPRKKNYLSTADSILDLPTYSYATFPELLDWSNDNILVAALGTNFYKWSWRTQSLISQGITLNEIQCCKFDPRGELLLLGTNPEIAEIHDNAQTKWLHNHHCLCMNIDRELCSITAIDWSPTGNLFVMGCSRGVMSAITRQAQVVRRRKVVLDTILVVRVSPDARFVAAASLDGKMVLVFTWPDLQLYSSFATDSNVKTLNWHPWRSALLGIGIIKPDMRSRIALWDAPSGRFREADLSRSPHSLDTMLFSHRTGEMVLSLWNLDVTVTAPKMCSQLVVMSDVDTVVDQWGEGRTGLDRVRTMVFSPDGTKLATATADEDLIIWNFLPEDNMKRRKNHKRFSAMPEYLDIASYGVSLR